jgi:hypothetical protein
MPEQSMEQQAARKLTIGSRLRSARSSRFVGRRAELELFERALDDPASTFAVLFLHGPPGVGKSALARQFAARAADRGRRVGLLDLRQVQATPEGVLDGLAAVAATPGVGTDAGVPPVEDIGQLDVVVLDTYELASALDGWVREHLVPSLPAESLVVIAGRSPPTPEWTADPGWRPLIRVIALRNLRPEDATEMLVAEGIDEEQRDRILDETFGHPLALCLYVDLLARGDADRPASPAAGLLDAPHVVRRLLQRFVDEVPSPPHRAVLELCAHVRFTTEELIRVAVDLPADEGEAAALFDWLRGLSFVDAAPEGLFPHDLARDLLDTDLRWRDASAYQALHMRVRRHLVAKVRSTTGRERLRVATDLVFLHRSNPLTHRFWDFTGLGQGYLDRLRPGDDAALRAMVEHHEGPESAAILDHWIEHQPEGISVIRVGADPAPQGFTALVTLDACTADDLAADPGARAMWDHLQRHGPPAPGEAVVACRFLVDRDTHQAPGSLTFGLTAVNHLQHMLTRSPRAMDFIGGICQPDLHDPVFNYIDFPRAPDVSYVVDGRTWVVYAHDWRGQDIDMWFDMIADRELGAAVEDPAPSETTTSAGSTIALSQPDFADAVRAALRDLHRPDRLRHNPLVRSRLVGDADLTDAPAALADVIRRAVDALSIDPRRDKCQRALDRTFVRPAPTQEKAAEVLGLPFSTYRRHLTRGIELVTSALWDRELYGSDLRSA